jgi:hypothetical protein
MVSLATTTASGWVSLGASSSSSRSGYGWSSAKERSHGTRRPLLRSASRQALLAIRYSQARNPAPSKLSRLRRKVSWTASSAIPGVVARWGMTGLRVRA